MRQRLLAGVLALVMMAGAAPGCGSDSTEKACVPIATESVSVARLWNEATLDAIRRDFPAPTVHARNLWHLSAVMWDAWAAYTDDATPYFDTARPIVQHRDRLQAIDEAASFAAHRLLSDRYEFAIAGDQSLLQFDRLMADLCYQRDEAPEPGSPAAIGLAIAESAIAFGVEDGSSEITRYVDLTYRPVNEPLEVATGEINMVDPNRWQPLQLSERVTQNGQALGPGTQVFIGSQWGTVASFALPAADERGVTIDPGPPPALGATTEPTFLASAIEVIGYADTLGDTTGVTRISISPRSRGNNTVGFNDGQGHSVNPATGEPYAESEVSMSDFGRSVAEFWADGPDSETPPGHWNTLATIASDQMSESELRWGGSGPALSRREWDLRLYFTLNASLHDAAIAAWGAKAAYDYARPISMIRYLGSRGELPPTPDLVEIVTAETAAANGRHEGMPVGATAVRSWLGPPGDVDIEVAGVGWVEATDWLPYQRPTFVSPAFAGYVSGHSAFSRAAADILTAATGDPFFPNGLLTHTVRAGSLRHEEGPSADVELQWATYADAADEAGESRLYGGIHVRADDFAGRRLGAEVADLAWVAAQRYIAE